MLSRYSEKGILTSITDVNVKRGFVTINANNNGETLDPMTITFKNYENLFPKLRVDSEDIILETADEFGEDFSITTSKIIEESGIQKGFKVSLFMKLKENSEINFSAFTQNLRLLSTKIDNFLKTYPDAFKFATLQIEGAGKFVSVDGVNFLTGCINIL